jgi:hypothetical protein
LIDTEREREREEQADYVCMYVCMCVCEIAIDRSEEKRWKEESIQCPHKATKSDRKRQSQITKSQSQSQITITIKAQITKSQITIESILHILQILHTYITEDTNNLHI